MEDAALSAARRSIALDVLIAVVVIGLIGSVAVPAIGSAVDRSRRGDAVRDLRALREAMVKYAGDHGRYPLGTGELDTSTLAPLVPGYLRDAGVVTHHLRAARLDWYLPLNLLDEPTSVEYSSRPQGFCAFATLAIDDSVAFVVTERGIYDYADGHAVLIRDK